MDEYAYFSSQTEQKTDFLFSNVQQNYVQDQNNGSYANGQVVFDLATLSNSGKYIDFQNSFIVVPLVMNLNLTGSTDKSAENAFAASLKNGFHQLINSMSVEIANCQVVNLTNMSNLDIHYRLLTTSSLEDERNFLPSINFAKDTAESINYFEAASATGLGETNNVIRGTNFTTATGYGASGWNSNRGRLERQLNTSFDAATSIQAGSSLVSQEGVTAVGKNHVVFNGNTDVTYNILATIPLKIIHDLFKKLHLTKGMYMRLVLNLNTQCSSVINLTNDTYSSCTTTSLNGVFPCMISPLLTTNGLVRNGTTKATLSVGIGKSFNTTTSFSHPTMTSCRFYARVIEMTPQAEELYLSAVPTKTILYNDILSFQELSVAKGATVSRLLTNGISRPRYLLIVPQLAGAVNGSLETGLPSAYATGVGQIGSPMNSPFSSSPGTTGFQAGITNLNVLVSGQCIYAQNFMYGFEEWLQEVRGCNSLNGGIPLALSSGLLSQNDWENGYRYGFVDLSRRVSQSNDDISRSLQLQFVNSSAYMCDYHIIVGYEKQVQISTSTGALII